MIKIEQLYLKSFQLFIAALLLVLSQNSATSVARDIIEKNEPELSSNPQLPQQAKFVYSSTNPLDADVYIGAQVGDTLPLIIEVKREGGAVLKFQELFSTKDLTRLLNKLCVLNHQLLAAEVGDVSFSLYQSTDKLWHWIILSQPPTGSEMRTSFEGDRVRFYDASKSFNAYTEEMIVVGDLNVRLIRVNGRYVSYYIIKK